MAWIDATLSGLVLLMTLLLFASNRVRPDLVALLALFACLLLGLVAPAEAFSGFSDPAVVTVAAALIIGRAVEVTGIAGAMVRKLSPPWLPFSIQIIGLLGFAALLSAFMNNIAALAITMPAMMALCRARNKPIGAGLMALAFATILGGMTTLVGTPANLILSSVRESTLGQGFGFFDMTPVALTVAIIGLIYLGLIGWRLTPHNRRKTDGADDTRCIFELLVPATRRPLTMAALTKKLTLAQASLISAHRGNRRLSLKDMEAFEADDILRLQGRDDIWEVARQTGLRPLYAPARDADAVTAQVVVVHGSPLIGEPYAEVAGDSNDALRVVATGSRGLDVRGRLHTARIAAGDQLYIHGSAAALSDYIRYARLLEVERTDVAPVALGRSAMVVALYGLAVMASVWLKVPTALSFVAAAAGMVACRFLPAQDAYRAIDWTVIVLLGAMIPVGNSFNETGAAAMVAQLASPYLMDMPLMGMLATMMVLTIVLSLFLNNVATAIIMGPIALQVATMTNTDPDVMLIAVLIACSSDFLTPIGHQNNLIVMAPGGYKFTDYIRVGAVLTTLVVVVTAWILSSMWPLTLDGLLQYVR